MIFGKKKSVTKRVRKRKPASPDDQAQQQAADGTQGSSPQGARHTTGE